MVFHRWYTFRALATFRKVSLGVLSLANGVVIIPRELVSDFSRIVQKRYVRICRVEDLMANEV